MGVDPGLAKTGWGVIRALAADRCYLQCGVIRTDSKTPHLQRIKIIGEEMRTVIRKWQPSTACVERVFTNVNPKSSLALGEARGAVIAVLLGGELQVVELSALQIKQSVTGGGRASKKQVATMVAKLLNISARGLSADATDALACALACTPMTQLHALSGAVRRRRRATRRTGLRKMNLGGR